MRLTRRRLNRATLARQLLLEHAAVDVTTAVARLGALQAQEPASPYLALWTRVADLDAADVDAALAERRLVKATLHRGTLHVATASDYLASVSALASVARTRWREEARGLPQLRPLPELAEASLAYASEPRTNVELRDHAGSLGEPVPAEELWRRIRRYGAFVHVPTSAPWSFGRRPVQIAARAWLESTPLPEAASLEHVVRSHILAFGPSRLADVARWSGLAVSRLKLGLDRIGDRVRHEDEQGRELWDLPGAPLPDADAPAPPRLLPMWDESLLAYGDRSRVLPEAVRRRVIVTAGDVLPTFTSDGSVAGLWWAEIDRAGRPRIVLEPFETLPRATRRVLDREAERLVELIAHREPAVFARYRDTGRRQGR